MKRYTLILGCALVTASVVAQSPPGGAPNNANRLPTGTIELPQGVGTKKDPKNLPNFSGVWERIEGLQHPDQTKIIPFMKPEAAAAWKKRIEAKDFHVPWSNCEPPAFPAMMTEIGIPMEILMTPGRVTEIIPDGEVRNIYTDGSAHNKPSLAGLYFGDAIGHWEGETLVVETVDLRPDNDVVMGLQAGTDQMKVMERLHLIAPDRLQDDITVTGLDYLKEPYKVTQIYRRFSQVRLGEFLCIASKNRNTGDTVDLTPPPL